MSSLLDVLRLEIELQAGKFIQGQKELQDSFDKLNKHLLEQGKKVEAQHRATADSISSVSRELQSMFGLLRGGLAAEAMNFMKDFAVNISNVTAALGRMSQNVGMAPQALQAWQLVVEQHGGRQEEATAAAKHISDIIAGARTNKGIPTEFLNLFGFAGMLPPDLTEQANLSTEQVMLQVVQAMQAYKDRQKGSQKAEEAGFSKGIYNTARETKTVPDLISELTTARKYTNTNEDIESGKKLQRAWAELTEAWNRLKTAAESAMSGPIIQFIHLLTTAAELLSGRSVEEVHKDHPDVLSHWYDRFGPEGRASARRMFLNPWRRLAPGLFGQPEPEPDDTAKSETSASVSSSQPSSASSALIANAIQKQEGYYPGSVAYRNNNPGNLKIGPRAIRFGAVGVDQYGHAIFPTYEAGRAAMEDLLKSHSGESLAQIGRGIKPGTGYADDPNWAAGVSRISGVDINQPLNFNPAVSGASLAMARHSVSTVNNSSTSDVKFGDIHMYGVNDVQGFGNDIQQHMARAGMAFSVDFGTR